MQLELSQYRIEAPIGEGGMATVYLAVQKSLDRQVALKVLDPRHGRTAEFTRRFLNEGRIVASLSHTNIVTIHDIGVEDGLHYIAMEYLSGGDLKQRIRRGLTPLESLAHVETIAGALGLAHARRIVHRDVKPANVLFRADGVLVLSDFGIAKQMDTEDLTLTGSTVGSPHYLSPEQARGKPVDARADIYSLGIMLHEMLTGRKPFRGASDIDTVLMHIDEPLPRLPDHLAVLQPLVDRMAAKAPEDRFADVGQLVRELRAARAALADGATLPGESHADDEDRPTREISFHSAVTLPGAAHETGAPPPAPDFQEADTLVDLRAVQPPPPAEPAPRRAPSLLIGAGAGVALLLAGAFGLDALSPPAPAPAPVVASPPPAAPPAQAVASVSPEAATAAAAAPVTETPAATSAPTAPAPAPAASAPPTPEQVRVAELIASAETALEEFRLTRPAGDNAWEYLREALAIDPGNPTAQAGIEGIVDRYVGLAKTSLAAGENDKARGYVARGLEVDADHADLLALQRTLAARPAGQPTQAAAPSTTEGELTPMGVRGEHPKQLLNRIKGFFD